MDYQKIIFQGYFDENNREHLINYFRRECKNAEKENYSADEFYSGCLKVIKHFETEINFQYGKRKNELHVLLNMIDAGSIDTGLDDPEEIKRTCKQELSAIDKNDFSVPLKHGGHLWNNDISCIKNTILEAQNPDEVPPPDDKEPENPHQRYFVNGWHWLLFNEWHENHIKNKLADYSFIYWVMYYDGFIYTKPTEFKEWIERKLKTGNLGKQLKQLRLSDADYKYSLYATLIDKYKLQSTTLQNRCKNTTIT